MGLFKKKNKSNKTQFTVNDARKTLHKNLNFAASEQYRLLRTNLQFTIPEDTKCATIGVTSGVRGEGKSTTAINLAYVLAENGHKTLLIDADLRIPSIARKLGIETSPGLTDLLLGAGAEVDNWTSELQPNLYILPSGNIPPNPSELLGSSRMEKVINTLKQHFDYIILDLPPVNIVSDAMAVAKLITGIVVVIRQDYASKKDVEQCFRQIKLSNIKVLGIVLNESEQGGGYYKHYSKGNYYKYYRYQIYDKATTVKRND